MSRMERGKYYYFFSVSLFSTRAAFNRLRFKLCKCFDVWCSFHDSSWFVDSTSFATTTTQLSVSSVDASYFPERMLSVAHRLSISLLFFSLLLSLRYFFFFSFRFFFFLFYLFILFYCFFFCCCSHDNVTINRIVDALVTSRETKAR